MLSISSKRNTLLFCINLYLLSSTLPFAEAINCYECDSFDDFTCTEIWDSELDASLSYLSNCSHVSDAKYCIKMTGIYQVCKFVTLSYIILDYYKTSNNHTYIISF